MRIGVISDLHIFNKTVNIKRALSKLRCVDMLLIAGDLADRGEETQYDILRKELADGFRDIPVFCVSGNHDNPARDDTNYRGFEKAINCEYSSVTDESGAFYKFIDETVDLVGLNPVYHQKQFFFPNKGQQLTFLENQLHSSSSRYHIVLCHPPLILHNPQRTADMSPYIVSEQDQRLQTIIDKTEKVIFISGHTHMAPTVEYDTGHKNLYINNGSICPTTKTIGSADTQQGNITLMEIDEHEVSVIVKGIHTEKVFIENYYFGDVTFNDNHFD